jgi:hypothetical protein
MTETVIEISRFSGLTKMTGAVLWTTPIYNVAKQQQM